MSDLVGNPEDWFSHNKAHITLHCSMVCQSIPSLRQNRERVSSYFHRGPYNILDVYSELAGAWVAGTVDTNQSVEVHMESDYRFLQIHIQGREDAAEWVTSFRILYVDSNSTSNDTNWVEYVDATGQNVCLHYVNMPG